MKDFKYCLQKTSKIGRILKEQPQKKVIFRILNERNSYWKVKINNHFKFGLLRKKEYTSFEN